MLHTLDFYMGWSFVVLALAGSAYTLLAAAVVARSRKRFGGDVTRLDVPPPVSILKPLCGEEPGLAGNLASFCGQDYPATVQLVCGVRAADDPAIAAVTDMRAAHPAAPVALVQDGAVHGSNLKISNVINLARAADHDVLILSDSDIRVPADHVATIVAELAQPGVGAVTCLYAGLPTGNVWSRLSAMGLNYHFLPNVLVGLAFGLAEPCFGATIAMRRQTLERIGGFAAFRDILADDYEIGRAVRALGLSVKVSGSIVRHVCAETSARALLSRELRWARTIRTIDAKGHWGSVVSHPLPPALLGLAFLGFGPWPLFALAAALGTRTALKIRIDRAFGADKSSLLLYPLRDLLSFGVFVASLWGGQVDWRGARFEVSRRGIMSPE